MGTIPLLSPKFQPPRLDFVHYPADNFRHADQADDADEFIWRIRWHADRMRYTRISMNCQKILDNLWKFVFLKASRG